MVRFIAFYLPQYHPTEENNKWWGNGFTEWTNVARAKKHYLGHHQPNIPADLGFYDLRLEETRIAQAELAKKYGIEGFCYWHYWFGNGKRLLELPFNEVVKTGKPNFPFCLAWANHSWEKKLWDSKGTSEMLIEQLYPGEEDYINHFYSLLPAFKDKRYIKVNNKLFFIIYDPLGSPEISKFIKVWRLLAKENGLNDFYFVARDADSRNKVNNLKIGFNAIYNDDVFNIHHHSNIIKKIFYKINRDLLNYPTVFNYQKAIKYMITDDCKNENVIPVIAPNWDHSPRSGGKAIILDKASPKHFKAIVKKAIEIVKLKPNDCKIVLIKSWNEWGEGNYMEPDLKYGRGNLESLKEAITESSK